MKKTFRMFGMALVAVLMAVSFSACSDDDDPADPETHDQELVGTWVWSDEGNGWKESSEFTFHASGKFSDVEIYWDEEDGEDKVTNSGTWETENGQLTITITKSHDKELEGESVTGPYSIKGDVLYFQGDYMKRK